MQISLTCGVFKALGRGPTAEIIPFPCSCKARTVRPTSVVTITRYAAVPRHAPYKALAAIPDGVSGWAVECLNHPGGGIALLGYFRDEATAWERARALAAQNGWQPHRYRPDAVAFARSQVVPGRLA
jgi:hypothetical protein